MGCLHGRNRNAWPGHIRCWVDHLVEHPVEAVLVVDDGGHKGQHQAPAPADLRVPIAVLHVLPAAVQGLLSSQRIHINQPLMAKQAKVLSLK